MYMVSANQKYVYIPTHKENAHIHIHKIHMYTYIQKYTHLHTRACAHITQRELGLSNKCENDLTILES